MTYPKAGTLLAVPAELALCFFPHRGGEFFSVIFYPQILAKSRKVKIKFHFFRNYYNIFYYSCVYLNTVRQ